MGQYYYIVNLDKKEYLHPHKFGDGLKLMEFGDSASGTLLGLAVLLADGNGRGGGDLHSESPLVGSWAGDRIVIAGDYADEGKFLTEDDLDMTVDWEPWVPDINEGISLDTVNLHTVAGACFKDISDDIIRAIVAAEGGRHPLAGIKFVDTCFRQRLSWDEVYKQTQKS